MKNMVARIKDVGDIFKGVIGKGINMEKAIRKLETMFADVIGHAA